MTLKEILELFPATDVVAGDIIVNEGGKRILVGRMTKGLVLPTPEGEELMEKATATVVEPEPAEPEPAEQKPAPVSPKPAAVARPAVTKPGSAKLADHLG